MHMQSNRPWWRTRSGVAFLGFLAIAFFFLFTEHRAHLFGLLPYLLILACPLMHLFMHHGHGGHASHRGSGPSGKQTEDSAP
jgi:hypothetical protein